METDELVEAQEGDVLVRATVHLPDLVPGDEVWINPRDPYMKKLLGGKLLVPVE